MSIAGVKFSVNFIDGRVSQGWEIVDIDFSSVTYAGSSTELRKLNTLLSLLRPLVADDCDIPVVVDLIP